MVKQMQEKELILKEIKKKFEIENVIKDVLNLSKSIVKENDVNKFVTGYLNSRRIGFNTASSLGMGFLPKGTTSIIPRAALFPNIKRALNSINGALIFPSFKNISVESFLGILRNIIGEEVVKHVIWKIKNDGNRFFHWGSYPKNITLVEGISDKMRLMQSDFPAIPTNGTEFDLNALEKEFPEAEEFTLFLDGDRGGKYKTLELVFNYLNNRKDYTFELTIIKPPNNLDPCDLSERKVKELIKNKELAEDFFKKIISSSLDEKDVIQRLVLKNIEKNIKIGGK